MEYYKCYLILAVLNVHKELQAHLSVSWNFISREKIYIMSVSTALNL